MLVVDIAIERILNIIFKYYDNRREATFDREADHELARKVAEESIVPSS